MAQVPYTSFYNGPFAVYTSPTGMASQVTSSPYLGGSLHEGDYCDLQAHEAAAWNIQFGAKLNAGRYRLVRVSPASTNTTIKYGFPVGWGNPTTLGLVVLSAGGSGATTDGTYSISSSTSGGTAATALATVSGGIITAVQLTFPGAGFTSVPTFSLSEIAGISGASVLAQMAYNSNLVGSFDVTGSVDISTVRAIALLPSITAAQITAGAWIVVQENGIAPVYVTTATATVKGSIAASATAGAVTTSAIATPVALGYIGQTLDTAAAATVVRVVLGLPPIQG
jgi:hypothetical protein